MIGTVTENPKLGAVKNGKIKALLLQVQFADSQDVRTVQYMPQVGEDTVPVKGSIIACLEFGGILLAVSTYDSIESAASAGEKEFYSQSDGSKKARLKLKKNGKFFMANDSTDLLTVFTGLIDKIKAITTAGSPAAQVVDPTAQASLEAYKNTIKELLDGAS